ncbi:T9SS type A sorting domain-containing protein [candidate division GN15 bacterium]|nr:T9SS type A sorting domain-containing protein [candidate division GN15 bacterium]
MLHIIAAVMCDLSKYILCGALAVGLMVSTVSADVDDFLVNDDGGSTQQTNPRIAVAGDGSFVIAWVDKRAGANDIYVQRYTSDGSPLGGNTRVNDDLNAAWQAEPALACDLDGRYWLAWKDYRNGQYPFDADIYFQRFDTSMSTLGVNRELTTELPDSLKETPDIAVSPTGAVVLVWADYRNANWDIYGQLVGADGALVGSNFRVNDDVGSSQQHAPRVAYSSDGWFVVVWYDNRMGHDDIFARRFDSTGSPLTAGVRVNTDATTERQAFPDVACDASGHFTVVWVDWRNGRYPTNPDIYSRKFDTTMIGLSSDTKLNTDASVRAQREPCISADRMGNAAIIWSDSAAGSFDIVGQMIDADGVVRETNFQANSFTDSAQLQADVALDGRFRYITWVDKRNGNFDIYASIQQYNDPTLTVAPAYLAFSMDYAGALPAAQEVLVDHVGYNPLDFEVHSDVAWLEVTPVSATTTATISVEVDDSLLAPGSYLATLTLVDIANNDSSVTVPVTLTVESPLTPSAADTLVIGTASVVQGGIGAVPIDATLATEARGLDLALRYDTTVVRFDSAVADPSLPAGCTLSYAIDDLAGEMSFAITCDSVTTLGSGAMTLAECFFTAAAVDARMPLDTAYNDTLETVLTDTAGTRLGPVVLAGEIVVGTPTAVGDAGDLLLPEQVRLYQNYPNPFNLSTTIAFELERRAEIDLAVYNVLGRRVRTLARQLYPAGGHEVTWDGRTEHGLEAASGVYFVRLMAGPYREARKMLLLK